MNKFVSSLSNVTYTENNMLTNKSSLNPCLDLFYKVGNRGKNSDSSEIPNLFKKAYADNPDLAIKIMGWSRSVRNGAGVRQHIRTIIETGLIQAELINWSWFGRNGYWKDLFYFHPKAFGHYILPAIKDALNSEDNLILKYLPRRKKKAGHKNNWWINYLRGFLELDDREYRKLCSSFVTPETKMCSNQWSEIKYEEVPSVCMNRNRKNFMAHDKERFEKFIGSVLKKETVDGKIAKMNVSALYPHQIIEPFARKSAYGAMHVSQQVKDFAQAQWSQLGEKFKTSKKIFVVADTSGSMEPDAICISKALAIFMAERLTGAFHNFYAIFSDRPAFFQFNDEDSIYDKVNAMKNEDAGSTDIEALFDMILSRAVGMRIPVEDMPETIMIISDMQFNASRMGAHNITSLIADKYKRSGYPLPEVLFWNVRNSEGVPVTQDQSGVALFSGASPNSVGQMLGGYLNPVESMMKVVDKEEYNFLKN